MITALSSSPLVGWPLVYQWGVCDCVRPYLWCIFILFCLAFRSCAGNRLSSLITNLAQPLVWFVHQRLVWCVYCCVSLTTAPAGCDKAYPSSLSRWNLFPLSFVSLLLIVFAPVFCFYIFRCIHSPLLPAVMLSEQIFLDFHLHARSHQTSFPSPIFKKSLWNPAVSITERQQQS